MNTLRFSPVMVALCVTLLTLGEGCKKKEKDPCEEVNCLNGGSCSEGTCTCEEYYYGLVCEDYCVHGDYENGTCECKSGYEGTDCNTEWREKFLGNFSVEEKCFTSSGTYEYSSVISTSDEGITSIEISNFRGDDTYAPVVALVSNGNLLTIEAQYPKGVQQVSGTGYINDTRDTIFIDYEFKASAGSNKELCTLVFY